MASKLYVGGLSWDTTTDGLRGAFAAFGEVTDAIVISDRETGRSRGPGFVTFADDQSADDQSADDQSADDQSADDQSAERARKELGDKELDGRRMRVDVAQERQSGGGGGGGGRW